MRRVYRFGEFVLDADARQLLDGLQVVHLPHKAFQLLDALIQRAPHAISEGDLQDLLWPDAFVVEANLQHLVGTIRSALHEDPRRPRFVRTVHRYGYAFAGPVSAVHAPARSAVRCTVRWAGGNSTLPEGEHVIGRDPAADVVIDSATVSRRHARLVVSAAGATVEDLQSKNGTFVNGERVVGIVPVSDSDVLKVGRVPIDVLIVSDADATATASSG
jgi:DNA-binding winged helix-turn-helix (wHTH) protein